MRSKISIFKSGAKNGKSSQIEFFWNFFWNLYLESERRAFADSFGISLTKIGIELAEWDPNYRFFGFWPTPWIGWNIGRRWFSLLKSDFSRQKKSKKFLFEGLCSSGGEVMRKTKNIRSEGWKPTFPEPPRPPGSTEPPRNARIRLFTSQTT